MSQEGVPISLEKKDGNKVVHKTFEEVAGEITKALARGGSWVDVLELKAVDESVSETAIEGLIVIVDRPYQSTGPIEN